MRRIMYIEDKSSGLDGPGRIGWVTLSKSGRTYTYAGRNFLKTKSGYKYNCVEVETGVHFWISGPRKDGADKMYGGAVDIDDDARDEYWSEIRGQPHLRAQTSYRASAR